jgi:hypothetical protein
MSEGRRKLFFELSESSRHERHQDDLLVAIENYVKNEESTDDAILKLAGFESINNNDSKAKLDIVLHLLDSEHRQKLKASLQERVKLSRFKPSAEVTTKTYWESLKASAIPALITTLFTGPIGGFAAGGAAFAVHQGSTQLSHRDDSNGRAMELLRGIARVESIPSFAVDIDKEDEEMPSSPSATR